MFKIVFKPQALRQLESISRFYAVAILNAIERYLSEEPERTGRSTIKRLRGHQDSTFRLRVLDYRVFYDVTDDQVEIVQILHKKDTLMFYKEGET